MFGVKYSEIRIRMLLCRRLVMVTVACDVQNVA